MKCKVRVLYQRSADSRGFLQDTMILFHMNTGLVRQDGEPVLIAKLN